jgi:hypothetical protein
VARHSSELQSEVCSKNKVRLIYTQRLVLHRLVLHRLVLGRFLSSLNCGRNSEDVVVVRILTRRPDTDKTTESEDEAVLFVCSCIGASH